MKTCKMVAAAAFAAAVVTGCAVNQNSDDSASESSQDTDSLLETVSVGDLGVSENDVEDIVEDIDGWSVSPALVINVADDLEKVSTFEIRNNAALDAAEFYEDFLNVYDYVFPDREMNDDCWYYYGPNTISEDGETSDLALVSENKESISSSQEKVVYFYYIDDSSDSRTFLWAFNPAGISYFKFNRGKAIKLAEDIYGEELSMQSFSASSYFECAGTYMPDSTESFELADGNMKICDAVDFYTEYLDSIPFSYRGELAAFVYSVDVYDLGNGTYGYLFNVGCSYNGLMFNGVAGEYSLTGDNIEYQAYEGFMLQSDEVDYMFDCPVQLRVENAVDYDSVITLRQAMSMIEEEITDSVDMTVCSITLDYVLKSYSGIVPENQDEYTRTAAPFWEVVLYNENDSRYYVCFVNAADGSEFRYYSAEPLESDIDASQNDSE